MTVPSHEMRVFHVTLLLQDCGLRFVGLLPCIRWGFVFALYQLL